MSNNLIEEQSAPIPNESEPIWQIVIREMQDRDNLGRKRYGTPLQAGNGRDMLVDLYQELLDAVVYVRGEIQERAMREVEGDPQIRANLIERIEELERELIRIDNSPGHNGEADRLEREVRLAREAGREFYP